MNVVLLLRVKQGHNCPSMGKELNEDIYTTQVVKNNFQDLVKRKSMSSNNPYG